MIREKDYFIARSRARLLFLSLLAWVKISEKEER